MQTVYTDCRNGYAPPRLGYPWLEIFSSNTKPGEIVKISPSVWVTYEMHGPGVYSHGRYIYNSMFVVSVNAGKTWHKDVEKFIPPHTFKNVTITPAEHQTYRDAMGEYQVILAKERKKTMAKAALERRKSKAAALGISLKELSELRKAKTAQRKEVVIVQRSIADTQNRIELASKLRELIAEAQCLLTKVTDENEDINLSRITSTKKNIKVATFSIKRTSKQNSTKKKK